MDNYVINNQNIMSDWDYAENNKLGLDPDVLTDGSSKDAHFICSKCGYKWVTRINTRRDHGCPACTGKVVVKGFNDLQTMNPLAAKEWDYKKNYPWTPSEIHYKSDKRAYFKCSKCGYEWDTRIGRRMTCGCPACANRVVIEGQNDLKTTNPEVAERWDYTKNGDLKPTMVTAGSGIKAYFICPFGHSYKGVINQQTNFGGCPICKAQHQTSFSEQALYHYILKVYPDATNKNQTVLGNGMELDIYIPSLRIAIEYDGSPWHQKDEKQRENKKYLACKEKGIYLIRVKESQYETNLPIADKIYVTKDVRRRCNLDETIADVIRYIDRRHHLAYQSKNKLEIRPNIIIDTREKESLIYSKYVESSKKDSFAALYPELAKDWDYKGNGSIKPDMVSKSSRMKMKWICRGCKETYITAIGDKVKTGHYCEDCRKKRRHIVECLSERIGQYDRNGKLIKVWESEKELCDQLKIRNFQLVDSILDNVCVNGYYFKCISNFTGKPYHSTIVCKLNENGKILEEYKDVFDAANTFNTNYKNIHYGIIGKGRKSSYGFKWMYKEDL